jgi:hypothetical protein
MKQASASSNVHGGGKLRACRRVITKRKGAHIGARLAFSGSDDREALGSVRLAPIATHEPVGTVAYSEERETGANERAGYTTRLVTLTTSIALTPTIPISWVRERGNRQSSKRNRGDNQLFHFVGPFGSIPNPRRRLQSSAKTSTNYFNYLGDCLVPCSSCERFFTSSDSLAMLDRAFSRP